MKGQLYKTEINQWFINYNGEKLPLHPKSNPNFYDEGSEVNFIIVDEFTHPDLFKDVAWGDGTRSALLNESIMNQNLITYLNDLAVKNHNDMDFGRVVRKILTNI